MCDITTVAFGQLVVAAKVLNADADADADSMLMPPQIG